MNQPEPPPEVPARTVWLSLLIPPALALVLFLATMATGNDGFFFVTLWLIPISVIVGWIFFCGAVSERYRGSSLVLLAFAYPILEAVICLFLVFAGCLFAANLP